MAQNNKTIKNKVLFFDDEPFISEALADSLTFLEWNVTFVNNINGLFEELKNNSFDILILDIMAPIPEIKNEYVNFTNAEIKEMEGGMNTGIVLARKIWEFKKSIPILFLSARLRPDSIKQFIDCGKTCDCLRKPELAQNISSKLQELIDNK